jgi:hypothetical protein
VNFEEKYSNNLNERSGCNYKEAAGLLWLTSMSHEEALKFFQGVFNTGVTRYAVNFSLRREV